MGDPGGAIGFLIFLFFFSYLISYEWGKDFNSKMARKLILIPYAGVIYMLGCFIIILGVAAVGILLTPYFAFKKLNNDDD